MHTDDVPIYSNCCIILCNTTLPEKNAVIHRGFFFFYIMMVNPVATVDRTKVYGNNMYMMLFRQKNYEDKEQKKKKVNKNPFARKFDFRTHCTFIFSRG